MLLIRAAILFRSAPHAVIKYFWRFFSPLFFLNSSTVLGLQILKTVPQFDLHLAFQDRSFFWSKLMFEREKIACIQSRMISYLYGLWSTRWNYARTLQPPSIRFAWASRWPLPATAFVCDNALALMTVTAHYPRHQLNNAISARWQCPARWIIHADFCSSHFSRWFHSTATICVAMTYARVHYRDTQKCTSRNASNFDF